MVVRANAGDPAPDPATPQSAAAVLDDAWKTEVSKGVVPFNWRPYGLAAAVLAALMLLVAQVGTAANQNFVDGAAVLAMISLVALGIERAIEGFWSIMARQKDAWWPLNEIGLAMNAQVNSMNLAVRPVFDTAVDELNAAKTLLADGSAEATRIAAQIAAVQQQRDDFILQVQKINALAKDDQRVNLIATAAVQASSRVDGAIGAAIPAVREAFNDATIVATGAVDLLAGFKDNPAKKMLSLAIGMGLGLLVAGLLRLDLFAAAGAPLTVITWNVLGKEIPILPFVGVAVTGIVLGLGSNPTHQVVSWATDVAQARKTAALGVPETADGESASRAGTLPSGGLGAALAAAANARPRQVISTSRMIQVPATRFLRGPDMDSVAIDGDIEVNLDGLVGFEVLRRTDSGRKILTVPGDAVVSRAGIDPAALRGRTIQADMTGIHLPGVDEDAGVVSPPRVRPVSLNLRRR